MAENKVPAHTVPHLACEYPNVSRFLCLHTEWASQVPDSSLPTAVPRKRATHRLVGQQRLLHYWQIMKCVYISNNQQDSLQGYLNEIRYILSETRTHSLSLSHTHTTGWEAINYWPQSCLGPKTRQSKGTACPGSFLGFPLGALPGAGQPVREARAVLALLGQSKLK